MTRIAAIAVTTNSLVELGSAVVRVEWMGFCDSQVTLGYTYAGQPATSVLPEDALITVVEA